MRLTDDQLRDVLARAEEIQRESRYGDELTVDLETVIGAAEEMGLTRPAVERALRERLTLSAPPGVGELTFAESENGKFYVARVLAVSKEGADVRFLSGGEHYVSLDQLRRCAFMPGEKVTVNWPWWGPWTCTVAGYDDRTQHVTLSDGWGSTETFPISDVWLNPARESRPGKARQRVYMTLLGAGAGIGALIGSIATALLMR
ncbi:MAG TPA: tudor domain-containing protein [Gemmatimonadaceae bacterium]|nr:tudor domain-containing protein [Gemmatimonadaceae bacterium]